MDESNEDMSVLSSGDSDIKLDETLESSDTSEEKSEDSTAREDGDGVKG